MVFDVEQGRLGKIEIPAPAEYLPHGYRPKANLIAG
jgi:hypothetical protein